MACGFQEQVIKTPSGLLAHFSGGNQLLRRKNTWTALRWGPQGSDFLWRPVWVSLLDSGSSRPSQAFWGWSLWSRSWLPTHEIPWARTTQLGNSWFLNHRTCAIVNICCSKSFTSGAVCYTAVENELIHFGEQFGKIVWYLMQVSGWKICWQKYAKRHTRGYSL